MTFFARPLFWVAAVLSLLLLPQAIAGLIDSRIGYVITLAIVGS